MINTDQEPTNSVVLGESAVSRTYHIMRRQIALEETIQLHFSKLPEGIDTESLFETYIIQLAHMCH